MGRIAGARMAALKSFSEDQSYIIKSIMELNNIHVFDADLTYGNGQFWRDLPRPKYCFDIDPQQENTIQADSCNIPLENETINSAVFDPPFLTYIKQGREHNSIMGKRFSGYWRYDELQAHYTGTLLEAHRILKPKGILVFKCQDIVHNHALHPTHINIMTWAGDKFRLKDFFILAAKNRMPMPEKKGERKRIQKHARIHHSYFMVLERR
jgi:hypothetical protein